MTPAIFLVLMVVALIVIVLAAMFNESARLRRLLRNAPRVSIKEFPDGGVGKIVGTLEYLDEPLTAPLSQRPCALYDVLVEEKTGNKNKYWRTMVTTSENVRFRIRDDTGYAIIDPTYAQFTIVKDNHSQSGTFDDPTEVEKAFLSRHGQTGTGWVFNKTLRYREGVLEAGEEVAILGFGMREPDPEPDLSDERGYRAGPPTRLVMSGGHQKPLTISDEYDTLR